MEIINAVTVKITSLDEFAAAYDMVCPEDGSIIYAGAEYDHEWSLYDGNIMYRKWERRDT